MNYKISILSVIACVCLSYSLFAQDNLASTKPVFPSTATGIVEMLDGRTDWLVASDQGKLVVTRSDDSKTWVPFEYDDRGLFFSAVRDISVVKTFGTEQAIVFTAHAEGRDGLYALVPRNGHLELLTRVALQSLINKSISISAAQHYPLCPGKVRSVVAAGQALIVADWSPYNGLSSSRRIDLPFAPQGLAIHPAWVDGNTRVLAWNQNPNGVLHYSLVTIFPTTESQITGSCPEMTGTDVIVAAVAGGPNGSSFAAIGQGQKVYLLAWLNGQVQLDKALDTTGVLQQIAVSSRDGRALLAMNQNDILTISLATENGVQTLQTLTADDHFLILAASANRFEYLQSGNGVASYISTSINESGQLVPLVVNPALLRFLCLEPDGWQLRQGLPTSASIKFIRVSDVPGAVQ